MLESGTIATVAEITGKEKINASHVSRVLRLKLLASAIVAGWQGRRCHYRS